MKIKSLFDCLPPARELPPEPMPSNIVKRFNVDGKIKDVVVKRKAK